MKKDREIPTLAVVGQGPFRVEATSYNRTAPSGLGEFDTKGEAEHAMKELEKRMVKGGRKGEEVDLGEAVWNRA